MNLFHSSTSSSPSGRMESIPEDFNFTMAAPTSSYMVGRCFEATEPGSYFDGTGFLKAGETSHWFTETVLNIL